MSHELNNPPEIVRPIDPEPIDPAQPRNNDDLQYTPVWQGEGDVSPLVEGSVEYQEVLEELEITADEFDINTFDYTDYLASTGQIVFADYDPRAQDYANDESYQAAANSLVARAFHFQAEREKEKHVDPNGGIIKPIYIEAPPEEMPKEGTYEYELLLYEIGVDPDLGIIPEDFNYKAHIAATRRPKHYPDWLDPVVDIDDRWHSQVS